MDGQEVYVFTNKTQVTLSGGAGDDDFDITLPDANGTPITGLTTIVTQGANGSDSVTLRDETSTATTYGVAATGAGATTVTAGGLTLRTDTVDQLAIEGDLAQGDLLTVTGTGATDTFTLESVATPGSGRITMSNVSFSAVPLQFSGFSPASPIRFDVGQGGNDTFVLRTSDQSDGVQVTVAGGNTFVTHQLTSGTVNAAELVGFSAVTARTLGGPDFVRIVEPILPVLVEAGSASEGNVLTYVAGSGTTDIEFGPADEVVELTTGAVPVTAIGIQTVQATVTQAPSIRGSSENERMTVTPADSGNGATVSVEDHPTSVQIVGANTFNVDLSSGDDRLRVVGDSSGESIDVSDTSVTTPKGTVNFTNTEALEVFGQEGSDTFNVTPGSIPMFLDGGDPIGVSPGGDRIVVTAVGPIGLYAGPENDEGSVVVGTSEPVSFDHIEDLDILGGPGAGPVTVFATNADDEITVIARDSSTRTGADGIQDFTISINDGVEVYFQDIAQLGIDGLAGDDDFTLRTPAPNGAVWNTDVTFVGGPGTDVLDLETPGDRLLSVNVTPTGPETGRIELPEISSTVALSQDPLPQTTPPIIGGNGGFERINVDGETNGDRLTVFGSQGDDTIVHTPGSATDAGEVRVGTWLPVGYEDLGTAGTLTIDGATGNDTLSVLGTSGRDQVNVASGSGAVSVDNRQVIQTNAIETLSLETLSGDDIIDVASPSPYANVVVEGGDPGTGSDVLRVRTTQQSVDSITWSPARNQPTDQTLAVSGGPTYALSGIEEVELEADANDTIDLLSGSGNDTITVDAGAFGQRLTVSGMPPLE
ncbi:MAG TPA: hypothetical protein ENJ50_05730, partial [Planctomycetaceae bacterium]|nr:hypothetical protein [Planctomycetaceae bacterium]